MPSFKEELKRARNKLLSPKALALASVLTFSVVNSSEADAQSKKIVTFTNVKSTTQKSKYFFVTDTPRKEIKFMQNFEDAGYDAIYGENVLEIVDKRDGKETIAVFPVKEGAIYCGFINHPENKTLQKILADNNFVPDHKDNNFLYYSQVASSINEGFNENNFYFSSHNTSPEKLAEGLDKLGYAIFANEEFESDGICFLEVYDYKTANSVGTIRCKNGKANTWNSVTDKKFASDLASLGFSRENKFDNIKGCLEKDTGRTAYVANWNDSSLNK